jgi:hypothetical protein
MAFPIFWTFLPKKGNSNTKERIELLNRFIDHFGTIKIDCLLADREFIGKEWFRYLNLCSRGSEFAVRNFKYL